MRFVAAPMRKEAPGENPMNIQAKVAIDKQKHPERFCPVHRCLWRTAVCDPMTRQMKPAENCVGGHCPRHRSVSDAHDVEGDSNSSSESTTAIVSRLRSYRADEEKTQCPSFPKRLIRIKQNGRD
jgi:hypothetical protein